MAMVNDGSKNFDHQNDGATQQLGGCLRDFRCFFLYTVYIYMPCRYLFVIDLLLCLIDICECVTPATNVLLVTAVFPPLQE
jgi:hypothetical protein